MTYVKTVIDDLRQQRLWPVALALVIALVAVPLLLSGKGKGAAPAQVRPVAPVTPAASSASGVPVVSVNAAPTHTRLHGHRRDPFHQPHQSKAKPASASAGNGSANGNGGGSGGSSGAGSTGSSTSTTSTTTTPTSTTPTTTPPPTTTTTPAVTPPPAPTGLTDVQSYHVGISMTNSAGGVDSLDPVKRLTVLPSERNALLVELGVLKGGRRVLFAVRPGAVLRGPGTCTPGPIDCQILALGPNQIEKLSGQAGSNQIVALTSTNSSAPVDPTIEFAVTGITAQDHPSTDAANRARRAESAAGRTLLGESKSSALSLFHYDPSIGAVIDLRNLTVGGS
jgi:hypothetical protein